MTVKYMMPNSRDMDLTSQKIYNVESIELGWYRMVEDSGEDYLYPPKLQNKKSLIQIILLNLIKPNLTA